MNKLKLLAIILAASIFSFGSAQAGKNKVQCSYTDSNDKSIIASQPNSDACTEIGGTIATSEELDVVGICTYRENDKWESALFTAAKCANKNDHRWVPQEGTCQYREGGKWKKTGSFTKDTCNSKNSNSWIPLTQE